MLRSPTVLVVALALCAVTGTACTSATRTIVAATPSTTSTTSTTTTTTTTTTIAPETTTTTPPTTTSVAPATTTTTRRPTTTTTRRPTTTAAPATTTSTLMARGPRWISEPEWAPFATTAGLTLLHPADRIERVAFHQSSHDGASQLEPASTAVNATTLESRNRDTPPRGASDIVVDPASAIRSPVTGTVKRGGSYTLYCKHRDSYTVIAPDDAPHLEVKILHITGLQVHAGHHVVAGETVVAERATQLPFKSQVDEMATADPPWPHVHIEVIDPAVQDRPSPGGGC